MRLTKKRTTISVVSKAHAMVYIVLLFCTQAIQRGCDVQALLIFEEDFYRRKNREEKGKTMDITVTKCHAFHPMISLTVSIPICPHTYSIWMKVQLSLHSFSTNKNMIPCAAGPTTS